MSDELLHVEFYTATKEDKVASTKEGRPIFADVEMVKIMFPADRKRELHAPAHETTYIRHRGNISYAERFPQHYEAYKAGADEQIIGTPLDALTLSAARVSELRTYGLKTVEQLAAMHSLSMQRFGPTISDDHEEAKAYLAANSGGTDVAELKARIAELEALANASVASNGLPTDQNPVPTDEFQDMDIADIKAAIRGAGGTVPSGNAGRATLVEALRNIGESE